MRQLIFRKMVLGDLPAVLIIEQQQQFPWSPQQFQECLTAGYQCIVAEKNAKIVGFAVMSWAADECEILNIAIDTQQRRQGFGGLLLGYLLQLAWQLHAQKVYLEVRKSNLAALALYKQLGFELTGQRKDYYRAQQGREDALLLCYQMTR